MFREIALMDQQPNCRILPTWHQRAYIKKRDAKLLEKKMKSSSLVPSAMVEQVDIDKSQMVQVPLSKLMPNLSFINVPTSTTDGELSFKMVPLS